MVGSPSKRVLLVEDELLIAMELQETVEGLGHVVIGPAHTCESALALLASNDIDAAVLDLILGDRTCEDVANELTRRQVPWALSSGFDAARLKQQFPGVAVLSKPSDPEEIAKVLDSLLN